MAFEVVAGLEVELFVFPGFEDEVADGGFAEDLLVLEFWGEVDAVVLTDVLHGLWGKFLGFGRNAHRFEDVAAGCQITGKSSGRDTSQFGEFLLADEKMLVVVIYH